MFVLCPHCQFLVALDPASGRPPPLCPRCRERLLTAAPDATDEPAAEAAAAAVVPDIEPVAPPAATADAPVAAVEIAPVAEPLAPSPSPHDGVGEPSDVPLAAIAAADAGVPPADMPRAAPVVVATRRATHVFRRLAAPGRRRAIAVASLPLLAILLLLQSLLSDRAHLAADARWRPLVASVCRVLQCTLPPWHEPEAFTLLDRDVRPDPRKPGVLHVSAGFRNDARWAQPWPALLLTLSDADGRIAGERAFRPDEYLATPPTQEGLGSGQVAKVSFDVIEPTRDVVAFTFDFR